MNPDNFQPYHSLKTIQNRYGIFKTITNGEILHRTVTNPRVDPSLNTAQVLGTKTHLLPCNPSDII